VVDIFSYDAIMYIQYKERSRHMVSRGFKASLIIISTSMWLQGCSSMSTGSQDGFMAGFMRGLTHDYRDRPWDPPVGVGYGGRIPNMQGDWDRFCGDKKGIEPACR
jgi:hypothetical protein